MALNFYARFKFATELLPLLQAAKDAGEEARVVTVYSAGRGEPVDLDDLGLHKTFSPLRAKNQAATYSSLAVEVKVISELHIEIYWLIDYLCPGVCATPPRYIVYPYLSWLGENSNW